MSYQCEQTFMVRVPSLPLEYLQCFMNDTHNIKEIVESNDLMGFIRESLLISSPSLYKTIDQETKERKKLNSRNIGLYKYLTRATTRPTPFGLFAGVGLGKFSEAGKTKMIIDGNRYNKDVKIDTLWLCNVIGMLETDDEILNKLQVRFNRNCYISGDRLKNPYYSNNGSIATAGNFVQENNIRFTQLIDLIMNSSESFIGFNELTTLIVRAYEGIEIKKVHEILKMLIKNEYLITELRLPTFCEDGLTHILNILEKAEVNDERVVKLKEIKEAIVYYQKIRNPIDGERLLKDIYFRMRSIFEAKNYLEVNKGISMKEHFLPKVIQDDLTHFVNEFSKIMVSNDDVHNLEKLISQFSEVYGRGVEIPLTEIIDENKFNGMQYIESSAKKISNRENVIRGIVDERIQQALLKNHTRIELKISDFPDEVLLNAIPQKPKSFDVNIILNYRKDGSRRLQIGPNFGSHKAGCTFQRFSDVLDKALFSELSSIYKKEELVTEKEYVSIEGRELSISGRSNNLLNRRKNYKHCLPIAFSDGHDELNHTIHDLYIGLSLDGKMYIFSRKLNKKCKIISDNMLNMSANGKVLRFLKTISNAYENSFFDRLSLLHSNKYSYTPEITFENVVISPQKWTIEPSKLDCKTFENFCRDFKALKKDYQLKDQVYLCDYDNRLLLQLESEECLQILYQTAKAKGKLELCEFENDMIENAVTMDQFGRNYFTEIICSMVSTDEKITDSSQKNMKLSRTLQDEQRILAPFEEGWVYLKLYGIGNRADDVICGLNEIVNALNCSQFFYIRYTDYGGNHLRIRFKFESEIAAINQYSMISTHLFELKERGMISKWILDTYEREFNRYGGAKQYNLIENLFFYDSMLSIELLKQFRLNEEADFDIVYILGMTSILAAFYPKLNDLYEVLDTAVSKNKNRDEFQKKRLRLINLVECVLNKDYVLLDERLVNLVPLLQKRDDQLNIIRCALEVAEHEGRMCNELEHIVLSLVHMFCNRINGNSINEDKNLTLIRHSIFSIVQKRKLQASQVS